MTKIGIITFYFLGYGAVLQAYALQKILSGMGFYSEIIDYRDESLLLAYSSIPRRLKHFIWHGVVKNIIAGRERQRRTTSFCQTHICLSSSAYHDMKKLHLNPPLYDIYLAGSDQVWNPNISTDPSYLLSFAPVGKKRISYAASFGVSQINSRYVDAYLGPLNRIDCLSVRELEGRNIIKQLTGRDAEVVLDPTLLLDKEQWDQIAVSYEFPGPYILCYYVPGDKKVNESITKIAHQVSSLTGWAIICIGQKEYMRLNPWRRSIFDAGPSEFLGLFQKASFVVTNSFHGTIFSINYGKPFCVPINQGLSPEKSMNSRITTILKTLKLEHRILPLGEIFSDKNILDADCRPAETILQEERRRSINFLKNALGDA